ncbi:MAG: hypothetical protein WDZ41_04850 [Candidatus Babeliales bacterium]
MKFYFIIFSLYFLLFPPFFLNTVVKENIDKSFAISFFTELIYRRYYFVARLEKTVNFITTLKNKIHGCIKLEYITHIDDINLFKHVLIKESVAKMNQTKSLEPIIITWHDFKNYKFLEDEIFLDDFTKLILIISKKLFLHIMPKQPTDIEILYEKGLNVSSLERLDFIDNFIEKVDEINEISTYKSSPFYLQKIKSNFTEAIAQRFYYLQRLNPSLDYLMKHIEKKELRNLLLEYNNNKLDVFHHKRIQECIGSMEIQHSIHPLLILCNDIKQYKFLEDPAFIQESIKLIFILYKNIFFGFSNTKKIISPELLQQINTLYQKIDHLPLEEILNTIDMLAHELPNIVEQYELNSDLSWKDWFRKYWWAPPVIAGILSLKILLIMQSYKLKKQIYSVSSLPSI